MVQTRAGTLTGSLDRGIESYKGIAYGADTSGEHRFLPPRPATPWSGTLEANAFGPDAVQARGPRPKAGATTNNFDLPPGEDCLTLNVWTPASDNAARPVMVWLHGGGFYSGSGSGTMYDGANLSRRGDVVVVSINHRLGALGFLHLAYLTDAPESVNVGMLDIVLALEWIRDNIAVFGGDPGNVTIFGESGGGRKVTTLLAMPRAQGLFHKGVIESGPAVFMNTVEGVIALGEFMLDQLGIQTDVLTRLQVTPTADLLAAQQAATAHFGRDAPGLAQVFAPVADGEILPRQPFHPQAPSISDNIPILVGYNETEWTLFMGRDPGLRELDELGLARRLAEEAIPNGVLDAYRERYPGASAPDLLALILTGKSRYPIDSLVLAERKVARGQAPAYLYTLTYRTPAGRGALRTPHGLEIPFVFDNVGVSSRFVGEGDAPQRMADQMSEAWIAFAKTGNPAHADLPDWPPYNTSSRPTMVFNLESTLESDFGRTERQVWGPVYYGAEA